MRRRRVVRSILQGCVLGALIVGVWYGTRAEEMTIRAVSISGAETVEHGEIFKRVEAALTGSYAVLVPKRFAYTYPRTSIVREVERIPRIETASVERHTRTELAVVVTEHRPVALWCAHHTPDTCLFITEDGVGFSEAPELHGALFIRYQAEGVEPQIGNSVGAAQFIDATRGFARALFLRHGMRVHTITTTADGDIRYRIAGGGELLTAGSAAVPDVFGNLDSLLFSDSFEHLTPGNFQYIDLRFGNRIFVKEDDDEVSETDDATATSAPTVNPEEPDALPSGSDSADAVGAAASAADDDDTSADE